MLEKVASSFSILPVAHLPNRWTRSQLLVIRTRIKITMNNCHFVLLFVLSRAHYTGSWHIGAGQKYSKHGEQRGEEGG